MFSILPKWRDLFVAKLMLMSKWMDWKHMHSPYVNPLVQWKNNLFLSFALKPFAHLGVQMVGLVQDPEYVLAGVDGLE